MTRLPLLGLLLLATILPALAETPISDQMASLKKNAESMAAMANSGDSNLQGLAYEYREFSNNYSSVENAIQYGNYDDAIRTLRRWIARTQNEQTKKALTTLMQGLQKEQAAQAEMLTAKLTALLKKDGAILAAAKSPEEIAGVRNDLESFRDIELYSVNNPAANQLRNRISNAINGLDYWQRVIAAEQEGSYSEALQNLRNLRGNSSVNTLISSEAISAKYESLLGKMTDPSKQAAKESPILKILASIMARVKSPSDAAAAAASVAQLSQGCSGAENTVVNGVQNSLNQLARANARFMAGEYGRVISQSSYDSFTPYTAQIDALETELQIAAIIAANDLPDLGKPKAGEGLGTFLRRTSKAAYEKKDWPTLRTLLQVYASATGGGCTRTQSMREGVSDFLAAGQLEKAGQWGDAVAAYTRCVSSIGPFVPREEAISALTRLRNEHPEAFKPTGNLNGE